MSQIIKNLASGGPLPPQIPTSFVTDSGTAIPSANVLNVNGFDTVNNNNNGIETAANPNESDNLQVLLTNRLFGGGSTTGSGTLNLIIFPLNQTVGPASYRFSFEIAGRDIPSNDSLGYTVFATAKTDGTTASVVETPYIDADQDTELFTSSVGIVTSGNSIILQVTGTAGLTISYIAVGTYIVI